MKSDSKTLLQKHPSLNQLDGAKVLSHVQRAKDDGFINTLMLKDYDVPFKYWRNKQYKSLEGAPVNLTYYAQKEEVAGMEFEIMKVIRIRRS